MRGELRQVAGLSVDEQAALRTLSLAVFPPEVAAAWPGRALEWAAQTTVFDLPFDEDGVRELAALLKQRCGTGGTIKDGRIEIQGDQRERVVAELEKLGYKVKRVGG